jgi:hypothetical protein
MAERRREVSAEKGGVRRAAAVLGATTDDRYAGSMGCDGVQWSGVRGETVLRSVAILKLMVDVGVGTKTRKSLHI